MSKSAAVRISGFLPSLLAIALVTGLAKPSFAQTKIYTPIPLQAGTQISDRLSAQDIPTGEGGFARDYTITLEAGDQIVVDLSSEDFDTIVVLMDTNGTTVAENDDGPDGSTNSLLFTRITKAGSYIVRVRAFGETLGGGFKLKLTRLKPV